jgi:hypothetical protein
LITKFPEVQDYRQPDQVGSARRDDYLLAVDTIKQKLMNLKVKSGFAPKRKQKKLVGGNPKNRNLECKEDKIRRNYENMPELSMADPMQAPAAKNNVFLI